MTHVIVSRLCSLYDQVWQKEKIKALYKEFQAKHSDELYTINFQSFQRNFLDKIYHDLPLNSHDHKEEINHLEMSDIIQSINSIDLNINIDSENKQGLVKTINQLHVCKRCLAQGRSTLDARNISSQYILPRGDEMGIEKLTCNTCGSKWSK